VSALLSFTTFPRSRALTDALLSPPEAELARNDRHEIRKRLSDGIAFAAGGMDPTERVRIDGYALRRALEPEDEDRSQPFRWSPRTARREIGLRAVRTCLARRCSPLEAARQATELVACEAVDAGVTASSLGQWLGDVPAGGRAVVLAEVATWVTQFMSALDWARLETAQVGGRDRWWDCPNFVRIALRGRAEVRTAVGERNPVFFSMLGGRPTATSAVELALVALVEIAARPAGSPPARVIGWWPSCGRAMVVPVDRAAMDQCSDAVIAAVSRIAGRPGAPN
jgi:hypothetical protein